jgi:glycosyltransferase involved in cell wall biosynthesis
LVQIEYGELLGLIEQRKQAIPWVVTLHDVLRSETGETAEDRFEAGLIAQCDAVIVCSTEDAALVQHKNVAVVPNAAELPSQYTPSPNKCSLLFVGPFRYKPNLQGILSFLEIVYPTLRSDLGDLELVILGGPNANALANLNAAFQQPGVRVVDHVHNVGPWYDRCSVTINPVSKIRGSSIKVLESIAAGRVCVSTASGARGFRDLPHVGLVVVPEIGDFVAVLRDLLRDVDRRHLLEKPTEEVRRVISWDRSALTQANLYRNLFVSDIATLDRMHE